MSNHYIIFANLIGFFFLGGVDFNPRGLHRKCQVVELQGSWQVTIILLSAPSPSLKADLNHPSSVLNILLKTSVTII